MYVKVDSCQGVTIPSKTFHGFIHKFTRAPRLAGATLDQLQVPDLRPVAPSERNEPNRVELIAGYYFFWSCASSGHLSADWERSHSIRDGIRPFGRVCPCLITPLSWGREPTDRLPTSKFAGAKASWRSRNDATMYHHKYTKKVGDCLRLRMLPFFYTSYACPSINIRSRVFKVQVVRWKDVWPSTWYAELLLQQEHRCYGQRKTASV